MTEPTTATLVTTNIASAPASQKSLHEILVNQFSKASANLEVFEKYRHEINHGRLAVKPELSLALKQFHDAFNPVNPELPSKLDPSMKNLDNNLDILGRRHPNSEGIL